MLVSAYVIHTRPFQENKVLLDLLTREMGVVRAVYRLPKKGARVTPGPFLRYEIELKGRSELKTVYQMESIEAPVRIYGNHLYASMYVHELLGRLLPNGVPVQDVFVLYEWLLASLQTEAPLAPLLRRFESGLFHELGVGINMACTSTGKAIDPQQLYQFDFKFGLRPYLGDKPKQLPALFVAGEIALGYAAGEWRNKAILLMAKELHRLWLDYLLSGKPVQARRLLPKATFSGERRFGVPLFLMVKTTD